MRIKKKKLTTLFAIISILGAYIFVNLATFHDGLFHVYDNIQVSRVSAMYQELASGQFPVKYVDSFGHGAGYFLFKYNSPLIYYIGATFHAIGFSHIQSVKLIYLLFIGAGTLGMYVLLRTLTKKFASTVGALAFILSPYLYHDFFHRGSLAEASAFMLLPWIIWAFLQLNTTTSRRYLALGAIFLGLSITTHALVGFMAILVILIFMFTSCSSNKSRYLQLAAILLGIGVSFFYLGPSFIDRNLVQYENNQFVKSGYLDHPVSLSQQLFAPGDGTTKSAYLGITLLAGYLLLITTHISSNKFRDKFGKTSIFIIISTALLLYITSPASAPIWSAVVYLRYVQFPFRFLTITTVLAALGYGLLTEHHSNSNSKKFLLTSLVFLPFIINPRFHQPLGFQYGVDYQAEGECMTTAWQNEHLPTWVSDCVTKPIDPLASAVSGNVIIIDTKVSDNGRNIEITTEGVGEILIGKYYFPDWIAVDQNNTPIQPEPHGVHGLIKLPARQDHNQIKLSLNQTKSEQISNIITIISFTYCCYLLINAHKSDRIKKTAKY